MSAAPVLSVRGLSKHYRVKGTRIDALAGIDLDVWRGETMAIVGESGSGKTTLGNLILGLERASAGQILFEGAPLQMKRGSALRRRIQVVQQNPFSTLNPKRTVRATIELPLRAHKMVPRDRYRARAGQLLDVVGMSTAHMNRHPAALSGGQRQRVALPAHWRASPRSSCWTSRHRRSTFPFRHGFSRFWSSCSARSISHTSSSPTTSASCETSPAGSRSCTAGVSWRAGRPRACSLPRAIATQPCCCRRSRWSPTPNSQSNPAGPGI